MSIANFPTKNYLPQGGNNFSEGWDAAMILPWTPTEPPAPWQGSERAPHAGGCRGPGQPWSSGRSRGPGGAGPLGGSDHLEIQTPCEMRPILKFQLDQACIVCFDIILFSWSELFIQAGWRQKLVITQPHPLPPQSPPQPGAVVSCEERSEQSSLLAWHVIKLECLAALSPRTTSPPKYRATFKIKVIPIIIVFSH